MAITNSFRRLCVTISVITATLVMTAQERKLPAPSFTGGKPMNEVVANRHSVRDFDSEKPISDAVLGQLLWMSVGVNRPDAEPSRFGAPANRSNPTARNWQEIQVFMFGKEGVWKYCPSSHALLLITEGDHRNLLAGTAEFSQDFVMDAPYSVVFVADLTNLPDSEQVKAMGFVDAGIACENLNLACESEGIATVPRATMDVKGISALLGLTPLQIPIMNNPIGYGK